MTDKASKEAKAEPRVQAKNEDIKAVVEEAKEKKVPSKETTNTLGTVRREME